MEGFGSDLGADRRLYIVVNKPFILILRCFPSKVFPSNFIHLSWFSCLTASQFAVVFGNVL